MQEYLSGTQESGNYSGGNSIIRWDFSQNIGLVTLRRGSGRGSHSKPASARSGSNRSAKWSRFETQGAELPAELGLRS